MYAAQSPWGGGGDKKKTNKKNSSEKSLQAHICMYTYDHNCMLEATTLSLPHLILSTAK